MTVVSHTWFMIGRQLRNLFRQPIWIVIMLIQPMIWLVLYGQLFSKVPSLRGGAGSYVEFLAPGVIVMNAFFGSTWSGMSMIDDLDRSVIGRFLTTPVSRLSIVLSQIVRAGIIAVVQALVILLVGLALGVRVHGGPLGWLVVFLTAMLLACAFGGVSQGLALLLRREESMIGVANFVSLPLMFLSTILISRSTMPDWIHTASRFNPVDWGAVAARNAVVYDGPWGTTFAHLGYLLGLTVVTSAFAYWTLARYQRSL
jgi:ABC-2 type transport system permease protein